MPATKDQKLNFTNATKAPKEQIEHINREIKEIQLKKKKLPSVAPYYNLEMAVWHLDLISLYINMSDASLEYLEVKNNAYLENARKEYYKSLQLLEEIAGNEIDRPLSENKDYLVAIDQVSIRHVYQLLRKLVFTFDTLVDKMGESSKWKWSFVDVQVRIATLIKNMINFTDLEKYRNFKSEFFKDREDLLKLCKSNLEDAAKGARSKYEMSTLAPEDIVKAIALLTSLRSIQVLYAESTEAEKTKTQIDALKLRLESEEKKEEKTEKMVRKGAK